MPSVYVFPLIMSKELIVPAQILMLRESLVPALDESAETDLIFTHITHIDVELVCAMLGSLYWFHTPSRLRERLNFVDWSYDSDEVGEYLTRWRAEAECIYPLYRELDEDDALVRLPVWTPGVAHYRNRRGMAIARDGIIRQHLVSKSELP